MAWYDDISSTIGNAWDKTKDFANDAISAKAEQSKEEYRDKLDTKTAPPPSTAPMPINWQKWGVIAGGVGVLLAVYTLVRK